ncbi:MAG: hypothetical protein EXR06_01010 [Rickettsiales bacterium]|nr:hypothetical protein [Rickettsiales bacterium]
MIISQKNSLTNFYKIILAICLITPLSSCHLFNNQSDTIYSNENLGHSDNQADYETGRNGSLPTTNFSAISTTSFVAGSKDIPLAAGLNKVSDEDLDFDSASGSIIAITYKSSDDLQKVKDFYTKTLPQLGWKNLKNNQPKVELLRFKRDKEKLEIEFLNYNGDDLVKFFVETISR